MKIVNKTIVCALIMVASLGLISNGAMAPGRGELSGDYVLAESWNEDHGSFVTAVFLRVAVDGETFTMVPLTKDDLLRANGTILESGQISFVAEPDPGHRITYMSDFREKDFVAGTMEDTVDGKTAKGTWVLKRLPYKRTNRAAASRSSALQELVVRSVESENL